MGPRFACELLMNFMIPGAFDILVYTDKDLEVPDSWGESGPALICNSETVRFRTLSTTIHKVDSMVTYKSAWVEL